LVSLGQGRVASDPRSPRSVTRKSAVHPPNRKIRWCCRGNSTALFLLQRVRDEALRFAITFHRELRARTTTLRPRRPARRRSEARRQLLQHFGQLEARVAASAEEIAAHRASAGRSARKISTVCADREIAAPSGAGRLVHEAAREIDPTNFSPCGGSGFNGKLNAATARRTPGARQGRSWSASRSRFSAVSSFCLVDDRAPGGARARPRYGSPATVLAPGAALTAFGWVAAAAIGASPQRALSNRRPAAFCPRSTSRRNSGRGPDRKTPRAARRRGSAAGDGTRRTTKRGPSVAGAALAQKPPFVPRAGEWVRLHATLRRPRNFAIHEPTIRSAALARREVWVTGHSSGRDLARLGGANEASWLQRERERIGRLIDEFARAREREPAPGARRRRRGSVAPGVGRDPPPRASPTCSRSPGFTSRSFGVSRTRSFAGFSRERLVAPAHPRSRRGGPRRARPAAGYGALAGSQRTRGALGDDDGALGGEASASDARSDPCALLCLAATAIGLAWPGAPLDVSFQLSFASVLALIVATDAWSRWWPAHPEADRRSRIRRAALLAAVVPRPALLGTAPLVALHFNRWTPIGIVTNPILVPLTGTPATSSASRAPRCRRSRSRARRSVFGLARWPLDLFASASRLRLRRLWERAGPTPRSSRSGSLTSGSACLDSGQSTSRTAAVAALLLRGRRAGWGTRALARR